MNLTVRLGKLFYESSTGVPALLPCSQLPKQEGEISGNCLPNLTVRFILSPSTYPRGEETHRGRCGVSGGKADAVHEDHEEQSVGSDRQEHVCVHSVHVYELALGLKDYTIQLQCITRISLNCVHTIRFS